jgi:hypothetical protein
MDKTREQKLEDALREMLFAFSMDGALSVDGMKRRTDAKKHAREALALPKGERRKDAHGELRLVGRAEGYVMCRRKGCAVNVMSEREWQKLPALTEQ